MKKMTFQFFQVLPRPIFDEESVKKEEKIKKYFLKKFFHGDQKNFFLVKDTDYLGHIPLCPIGEIG